MTTSSDPRPKLYPWYDRTQAAIWLAAMAVLVIMWLAPGAFTEAWDFVAYVIQATWSGVLNTVGAVL